jgi:hypothetical protein
MSLLFGGAVLWHAPNRPFRSPTTTEGATQVIYPAVGDLPRDEVAAVIVNSYV